MPEFDSTIEYRPVPEFPAYMVGSDGSLWSCYSRAQGTTRGHRPLQSVWRQVRMAPKPEGYILVCLYRGDERRYVRLHILVLEAFVGPCPVGQEGCHENGIRADCRLLNLRWDTRSNNHKDKERHGTSAHGERNPMAKLDADKVIRIRRRRRDGATYEQIGKEFGISIGRAWMIVAMKSWRHIKDSLG